MKNIFQVLTLLTVLIISCTENREINHAIATEPAIEIPDVTTNESLVQYDPSTSLWSLDDTPYSGYIISYYPDSIPKMKTGIYRGRKQNQSRKWYPDGHLKEVANYHKGKLHGEKKLWSTEGNHILITHLKYRSGKIHGEQRQWYKTGEIYKILNFNSGKEEGLQQAFRKNGELYANYEAKEGRIFGLKKATLCYGLEDENLNKK